MCQKKPSFTTAWHDLVAIRNHAVSVSFSLTVLLLASVSLSSCWPQREHGFVIRSGHFAGWPCESIANGQAEVELAYEGLRYSFDLYGILAREESVYDDDDLINVCFIADNSLGYAGIRWGNKIFISLADENNTPIPVWQSALVHELTHDILAHVCLLEHCSDDPEHADPLWGEPESTAQWIVAAWRM